MFNQDNIRIEDRGSLPSALKRRVQQYSKSSHMFSRVSVTITYSSVLLKSVAINIATITTVSRTTGHESIFCGHMPQKIAYFRRHLSAKKKKLTKNKD